MLQLRGRRFFQFRFHCAPKGINGMQIRRNFFANGMSGLEEIFINRVLTKFGVHPASETVRGSEAGLVLVREGLAQPGKAVPESVLIARFLMADHEEAAWVAPG